MSPLSPVMRHVDVARPRLATDSGNCREFICGSVDAVPPNLQPWVIWGIAAYRFSPMGLGLGRCTETEDWISNLMGMWMAWPMRSRRCFEY